jgi:hypothetical protein
MAPLIQTSQARWQHGGVRSAHFPSESSQLTSSVFNTEINLAELQKTLDAQGLEIVDNQKENMVGRKKLAEQTRGKSTPVSSKSSSYDGGADTWIAGSEFKKVSDQDKLVSFRGLLKGESVSSVDTLLSSSTRSYHPTCLCCLSVHHRLHRLPG